MKVLILLGIYLCNFAIGFASKKSSQITLSSAENYRPRSPTVNFYLYTRSRRSGIRLTNAALPNDFDRDLPVYLLLHGFASNPAGFCQKSLRSALLDHESCNILSPSYTNSSIMYTLLYKAVAQKIGQFLNTERIDPANTIVIGSSLGAHIAGILNEVSNFTPSIIYALDPAGPLFDSKTDDSRLNPKSAGYVQVFHTNSGVFGATSALGHDDIFVNGGNEHPCCKSDVCRHNAVCGLFVRLIRTGPIPAQICETVREARTSSCRGPTFAVGFDQKNRSRRISHMTIDKCKT